MSEEAAENLDADADVAVANPQLFASVAELQPAWRILEGKPPFPLPKLEARHAARKNVLNPPPRPKMELCEVLRVLTQRGTVNGIAMGTATGTAT